MPEGTHVVVRMPAKLLYGFAFMSKKAVAFSGLSLNFDLRLLSQAFHNGEEK